VLPFVNMSGDAEQEYFSDGISEDIITDLCKVSALSVIARNSAFTFKGKNVDALQVARQLNVSHVLEGSVRKSGGRVRITAQLIDGVRNDHVWAERYDRELTGPTASTRSRPTATSRPSARKFLPGGDCHRRMSQARSRPQLDARGRAMNKRNHVQNCPATTPDRSRLSGRDGFRED
jgi:TolB-like protein